MTLAAFIDRSHREKEDWRYTDLSALLASSFPQKRESKAVRTHGNDHTATPTETRIQLNPNFHEDYDSANNNTRFVFINGAFQAQLSRFGTVPTGIFTGDLKSGYLLVLGEQTCLVTQPIEMIFATNDEAPQEISIKLSIEIGKNGRLTLLENHLASPVISTLETNIALHACAKFVHGKIVAGGTHLAAYQVHIASGGYYNNFSLLRGGSPIRNEINVYLEGEEAQTALSGVMLLRGSEHADTTTRVVHQAPHGSSRQIYKTVLDGKSHGVFQGRISIAKDAQKSDGYQLSRALLLSDQAEMDAKPELEIYADDVKCSHGSTIGDLDENAMFYLRSRGLDEAQARAILIEAFIAETLDEIHVEEWKEVFRCEIEGWAK